MAVANKEKKKQSTVNTNIFKMGLKPIQKPVVNFLRSNEISILVGDAGTGKDFCCMYRAIEGLIKGEFEQIVIIKPIVEVGKGIGFLPGEISDKVAPYQKSFYENLNRMLDKAEVNGLKGKIIFEAANFLRGNTFSNGTCVIVSESQNFTLHELVTISTRLDDTSKMFFNGDVSQSDIRNSGLSSFIKIVEDIDGIGILELGDEYQMRNKLIIDITKNYKKFLKNDKNSL